VGDAVGVLDRTDVEPDGGDPGGDACLPEARDRGTPRSGGAAGGNSRASSA
jgi:hypothetical protein